MKSNSILEILKYIQDYALLSLVLLAGYITKIYDAITKGRKPSLSWFLAEAVVTLFVAFSVYAVCDQYFKLNKMFTYVLCAWGGSLSTHLHSEVENTISVFFDAIKKIIKSKIK